MVTDLSDTCRQGLGKQESGSCTLSSSSLSLEPQQVGTSAPGPASVRVWQILSVPSEGSLQMGVLRPCTRRRLSPTDKDSIVALQGWPRPKRIDVTAISDSLVTSQIFSGTVPRRHMLQSLGTR